MSVKDILEDQPPDVVVEEIKKRITTAKVFLTFRILFALASATYSGIQSVFFSSNDILFRVMMTLFCITFSLSVLTSVSELRMIDKFSKSDDLFEKIVEYQKNK